MNPSPSTGRPTTILVVEDDRDTAELLRRALTRTGWTCVVAETGADGVATASRIRPDVVLLDLDLPDADGLDLLPVVSTIAPVIVLTGRRADASVVTGLERGAEDYVTKPFSPRVLIARIEVALRRDRTDTGNRIEIGPLGIDLERREAWLDGVALELTRRELDLLAHLAERRGVVVGRDELLEAVWQSSAEWQTSATVTEHVRRVRLKLGDPRWIESLRGVGYRFNGPPS
jgi:DNA-binding response OmpR family regulator